MLVKCPKQLVARGILRTCASFKCWRLQGLGKARIARIARIEHASYPSKVEVCDELDSPGVTFSLQ